MHNIDDLVALTELHYNKARLSLNSVIQEENRLRAELLKLELHWQATRQNNYEGAKQMRSLGADVIWEKWLEKSRASLNTELAKTLAKKEMHLGRIKKQFGKFQVAKKVSETTRKKAKLQSNLKNLDEVISNATIY